MPGVRSVDHAQVAVTSQLHHKFWFDNMSDCPDEMLKKQVFEGLNCGVDIGCSGPQTGAVYDNWPSAVGNSQKVSQIIQDDLMNGRVVGPWSSPPTSTYVASPLGAVSKGIDKIRLIHDLSFPPGLSINDHIDHDTYSLQYITVDQVAQCVAQYPEPGWLAKSDLSNAFKHIVVKPQQWHKLGFTWNGLYYCSTVLPFGCRSSPYWFNVFGRGLEYMAVKLGASRDTYHFLDDTVTCARSQLECNNSIDVFNDTARKAGFELQDHKCTRASQQLEFLGIVINTVDATLSISQSRMHDIIQELKQWQGVTVCTKRALLSIIGKLSFAAKVVRSGRTFLRRLIDLSKSVKHLHYKIKLNSAARADFDWWLSCIDSHNGVNIFPAVWDESKVVLVFTDASDRALGMVVNEVWSVCPFQGSGEKWLQYPIHVRELLAVCYAMATFKDRLCNRQVTFKVDNIAICYAINSGTSKCKATMKLIRSLYFMLCKYNVDCRAEYINTHDNILADSLSRLDMCKFHANHPTASKVMSFPVEPEYMPNEV